MSAVLATFLNGVDTAALPASSVIGSRALHYGDGVFRTLLCRHGKVHDLERQIAKLASDARSLALEPPAHALLERELVEAANAHVDCVLKLVLARVAGGRGYATPERHCDRLLYIHELPRWPRAFGERGIAARRSSVTMASQPALAGIKHLNRLEQVLAARDCGEEVQEALLGTLGGPVCGTRTNLFWVDRAGLHTPALDRCGVAGMMRDRVVEAAAALDLPLRIHDGNWEELMEADEVFVTNSLIGLWPLRQLDQRSWPARGPVTTQLMAVIDHPVLPEQ